MPKTRVSFPYVASNTERGRMLATLGAWSTGSLLVMVDIFLAAAEGLFGDVRISTIDLLLFNLNGALIVGWFGLLASSDKFDAMLLRLAKATRENTVDPRGDPLDGSGPSPGRVARTLTNLWIPVTAQFVLTGWLLYASGGPFSPFVMVPGAMVFIGQCVYHVPAIDLCDRPKVRDLFIFAWRVIRFYAYPQLIFASVLLVVAVLQIYHPLQTRPAPTAETMLATQLTLSIGLCAGFIARRFDRAGTPSTS